MPENPHIQIFIKPRSTKFQVNTIYCLMEDDFFLKLVIFYLSNYLAIIIPRIYDKTKYFELIRIEGI